MKTEPKNKNKLNKLEQEQNHRNWEHMEAITGEVEGEQWGKRYKE